MKRHSELSRTFSGIQIFHHNFPDRKEPAHSHPEHQFFLPLEGQFLIQLSDVNHKAIVSPGDLFFIPANTVHDFTSLDANAGEQLLGLISTSIWNSLCTTEPELCIGRAPQLLKELMWFLLARDEVKGDEVFAHALVQTVIDATQASLGPSPEDFTVNLGRIIDERLKAVLIALHDKFTDEIDLQTFAVEFNLTERTLQRLFQSELKTSPKQYLIKLRVAEAERLLKDTKLSVTDVAFEAGFGSFTSFIQAFVQRPEKPPQIIARQLRFDDLISETGRVRKPHIE